MSAINNPLIRAGQHLVGAVREASEHSLATLFAGDEKALEQRWACSAVQTKDGKWLVVLGEGHVQGGESVRIRVHDSGVFGRGNLRDRAWFEANAEQILLGALFIKDKGGAASVLRDGADSSKQLRIKIVELTTAPRRRALAHGGERGGGARRRGSAAIAGRGAAEGAAGVVAGGPSQGTHGARALR